MAVVADPQRFLLDAFKAAGQNIRGRCTGQLRYAIFNYPAQSRRSPK
jgi:hypothetical protein